MFWIIVCKKVVQAVINSCKSCNCACCGLLSCEDINNESKGSARLKEDSLHNDNDRECLLIL